MATTKKTTKTSTSKNTGAGRKKGASTRTTARRGKPGTSRAKAGTEKNGGKTLVVVESPAKAKTLSKYLGGGYRVEASVGHVKDLPERSLGVDIADGFRPQYEVLPGKEKVMRQIRTSAAKAAKVFLAPDPDREGEAIAWHIAEDLREHGVRGDILRATFNEITKRAVLEGLAHPRDLDRNLFEAQQARRILDRIVGYMVSPLLGKKISRGLSAGRVQSVAVRLVVERERAIRDFVPEEYWNISAECRAGSAAPFAMTLTTVAGEKRKIVSEEEAARILKLLGAAAPERSVVSSETTGTRRNDEHIELHAALGAPWRVHNVERKEVRRRAPAPFITSTLQQEASRKLGLSARQTMRLAQQLYEGIELGELGSTGLITYMRTDSTRIAQEAVEAVRAHIAATFGPEFVPSTPNVFSKKKGAQDAHEAIRPTDLSLTPERVAAYLDKQQLRLYELIWNRFVACQMADAVLEQTRIESEPLAGYMFAATGSVVKFPGFLRVYVESKDEADNGDNGSARLPAVDVGDVLTAECLRAVQKFTQPPPRYTEASLIKELESLGIGRPSTYATIVSTIQDRKYVVKDQTKRLRPTEVGELVTDLLIEHFPDIMDVQFTARMEEALDEVEDGQKNWIELLREFYERFSQQLEAAKQHMRDVKREYEATDILCDRCGQANLVIKLGRNGRFLACPRYPECRNTRSLDEDGSSGPQVTDEVCPKCGRPMVIRTGRYGRFLACSGYPSCKTSQPLSTHIACPVCGKGELVEAMSARTKKIYWRCSQRECPYVIFDKPVAQPCPHCGFPLLVEKRSGDKQWLACPQCRKRSDSELAPLDDTPSEAETPADNREVLE